MATSRWPKPTVDRQMEITNRQKEITSGQTEITSRQRGVPIGKGQLARGKQHKQVSTSQ